MALRTPMKAIRAKCKDCTCGQFTEIKLCPVTDCPLYEYRMGHRPKKDTPSEGKNDFENEDEYFIEEDTEDEKTIG